MSSRRYYSVRTGKHPGASQYDLPILLRLFRDLVHKFETEYYFQEAFGYECVDEGTVAGTLGIDIEAQVFRKLKKPDLWPVKIHCEGYSEEDLFDVIEFIYDHVSAPVDGYMHSWNGCGWHYNSFDREAGHSIVQR